MNKEVINNLFANTKTTTSERIWLKSIKFFYKSVVKNHKKIINNEILYVTPLLKVKQLKNKKKCSQLKEFPFGPNRKNRILSALKLFLNKIKNEI